jgi:four helix bundle protein
MNDEEGKEPLQSYRDLLVWQKAMDLVDANYVLSAKFPFDERYALTSQIRRAAVSVPSNIAEGYGCNRGDYVRHLVIANGSLKEIETQIAVGGRQKYISREESVPAWQLCQEVGKMLIALIKSLS